MPPTEEMVDRAQTCLNGASASFSISPNPIRPGQVATLSWSTTQDDGCGVSFYLNHSQIAHSGSKSVTATQPIAFQLTGRMFGQFRAMQTVLLDVNLAACSTVPVGEKVIRQAVQGAVLSSIQGTQVSQRAPAEVEVDDAGVAIKLKLKLAINNFANPNINVSMRVAIFAEGGQPKAFVKSYSVEVDWPWWITVLSLGVSEIVEEVLGSILEGRTKKLVLESLQSQLTSALGQLPSTLLLASIITRPDVLELTVCPR